MHKSRLSMRRARQEGHRDDWQDGVAYDVLRRQTRFGAGDVLLLLRQILPLLEMFQ